MTGPSYRNMTDAVIFGTAIVAVLYDIGIGYISGGDATISREIRRLAVRYPEIVFLLGALAAHWFWPVRGEAS